VGTLVAFREIAAETSSIVRYCQNTIGYSLIADLSLPFLAANCQAVSELSFSSWRRGVRPLCGKRCDIAGGLGSQSGGVLNGRTQRELLRYKADQLSNNQLSILFCTDSSTPPTLGNECEYLSFLSHLDTNKLPPSANFPDSKLMP